MQKITFTLICFFTLTFLALSQSNFDLGFKAGFTSGYCYSTTSSVHCSPPSPPLPPLPQITESNNSYQDGYNRGFLVGTVRRKSADSSLRQRSIYRTPPAYRPYISNISSYEMANVGMYKQQLYDERKAWIQTRITGILTQIAELVTKDNLPGYNLEKVKETFSKDLIEYVNSYAVRSADFADNYVFKQIVSELRKIEEVVYIAYNAYVDVANETKQKN
jgi:hypothetical protein